MLTPGIRLVERPGVLHFVDGSRVVSLQADADTCAAIKAVLGVTDGGTVAIRGTVTDAVSADAARLAADLGLLGDGAAGTGEVGALFTTAAAGGRVELLDAEHRLEHTTLHVLGDDDEELVDELTGNGLRCAPLVDPDEIAGLDPRVDLVVAVGDPPRPAGRLRAVNAACLAVGVPWLPVSTYDGAVLRVGPLVVPGATACFECAERRLAANTEYAQLYLDVVADAPAAPTPPSLRAWAFSLAALNLLAWVAGRDPRVPGRLLTLVAADLTVRPATVLRVPRCTACAGPDHLHAAAPWAIARDH